MNEESENQDKNQDLCYTECMSKIWRSTRPRWCSLKDSHIKHALVIYMGYDGKLSWNKAFCRNFTEEQQTK